MGLIHQSANTASLLIPGAEITSVCPDHIHPLKLQSACFLPTSGGGGRVVHSHQQADSPLQGTTQNLRRLESWSLRSMVWRRLISSMCVSRVALFVGLISLPPPLLKTCTLKTLIKEVVDFVADRCGGEELLVKMIQQEATTPSLLQGRQPPPRPHVPTAVTAFRTAMQPTRALLAFCGLVLNATEGPSPGKKRVSLHLGISKTPFGCCQVETGLP